MKQSLVLRALVVAVAFSLLLIPSIYAYSVKEYSKKYDAGRDIVILSPSNIVFLGENDKLVFEIIVFDENVASVYVTVCGKSYQALEEKRGALRIYRAEIPVKYTDLYSWKIRLVYPNGLVKTTCTGKTLVVVSSGGRFHSLPGLVWITPSIA